MGVSLSCLVVSLLILFLKGLPALGDLDYVRSNCTTVEQVHRGIAVCSYNCYKLDKKCTRELECWQDFVRAERGEATRDLLLLLYDANSDSTGCSNLRGCAIDDYRDGKQYYTCYRHPLREGVAYLHRPANPLPYVVIPSAISVVVIFSISGFLYCYCCNKVCVRRVHRDIGHHHRPRVTSV